MGGLGNQLFQIAAGMHVRDIYHREVIYSPGLLTRNRFRNVTPRKFDSCAFLYEEEIDQIRFLPERIKISESLFPKNLVKETDLFDTSIGKIDAQTRYLMGYFQSYSTVSTVSNDLVERFAKASETLPPIKSDLSEALAIHIRFGDYRTNTSTKKFHGLTSMSYYVDGVSRLMERGDFSAILIFSDEPNFALKEFREHYSGPLSISAADDTESPISDLLAMSSAKGLVMSNSTFSWWSAWLGTQIGNLKVVAPSPWFAQESAAENQLFDPSWVRVNRKLV
jgi:hypothetical protein